MTSSSTDLPDRRDGFLSADRGAWVRLAVVLALAVAALVTPATYATEARFTDTSTVELQYHVGPTPTPTPSAEPTGTAAPEEPTATAPATTTAPAGSTSPARTRGDGAPRRWAPSADAPDAARTDG
ncbi:hypothetical protein [Cellulomonas fimi]|uniref:Uncharacterized protein n=1 Tax=Cellulomonas fimi (strain ATCC 484 / DSM 20113 / JCM 1341 / CCUG 24087 / LMG 16345 / NBRC 15513 / NCIMB 8980 / NCTC 7547 / NRS-133) TaxID=590998 RepID=F4H046_CELFA|nr:hypothetical protein [Cellulomonas fimi]AEE44968.1 hypothetical protein Celf_0828 [Cellulomonas fimi ATCC 484]NNH07208.1 hypothetical protein [Cellulomonas fimi]VEH27830.1 Uncharacterised protein [Cellulomonas fimi]